MLPPPGYNLETLTEIAERVETRVKNLWASETGEEAEAGQPPKIKNYFFVAGAGGRTLFGASAIQDTRVRELIPVLTRSLFGEPGTFGFFTQPRTRTNANGVDLNRNLPTKDWAALAHRQWKWSYQKNPRYNPGKSAGSEKSSCQHRQGARSPKGGSDVCEQRGGHSTNAKGLR